MEKTEHIENLATEEQIAELKESLDDNTFITGVKIAADYANTIAQGIQQTQLEAAKIQAESRIEVGRIQTETIKELPFEIAKAARHAIGPLFIGLVGLIAAFTLIAFVSYHAIKSGSSELPLLIFGALIYGIGKIPKWVRGLGGANETDE